DSKSSLESSKSDINKKENKENKNKKVRRKSTYQADADFLMKMHKTVGNQEVQRMIQNRVVQAKMTVGSPNDIYEKEADAVAQKVVSMSDADIRASREEINPLNSMVHRCYEGRMNTYFNALGSHSEKQSDYAARSVNAGDFSTNHNIVFAAKGLNRKPGHGIVRAKGSSGGMTVSPAVESGINNLKGGGSSLDSSTRGFFEERMDASFSDVRIHSGNSADNLARSINAKAFTTGHDIVFAARQYNPHSREGKELIAHELTHVLQQGGGKKVSTVQQKVDKDMIQARSNDDDFIPMDDTQKDAMYSKGKLGETVTVKVCLKNNPVAVKSETYRVQFYEDAKYVYDELYSMMDDQKHQFLSQGFSEQFPHVYNKCERRWENYRNQMFDMFQECSKKFELEGNDELTWLFVTEMRQDIAIADNIGKSVLEAYERELSPDPDPLKVASMLKAWASIPARKFNTEVQNTATLLIHTYYQNGTMNSDIAKTIDFLWKMTYDNSYTLKYFTKTLEKFQKEYDTTRKIKGKMREYAEKYGEKKLKGKYKKLYEGYKLSKEWKGPKPNENMWVKANNDFVKFLKVIDFICAITGLKSYITDYHYKALERAGQILAKLDAPGKEFNDSHVASEGFPLYLDIEPGCRYGKRGARSLWNFMVSVMWVDKDNPRRILTPNKEVVKFFKRNGKLMKFYMKRRKKTNDSNIPIKELQSDEFKEWLMEDDNREVLWLLIYGKRSYRKLRILKMRKSYYP
ncbi:MAG: DUF4157 domain-containing protein, partial [bacterium]|nr:DUF4157 domain-containing protein [bacterium]